MAGRRNVKLRRGSSSGRSSDRCAQRSGVRRFHLLGSNAYFHYQPVAVEMREAIRTTSMMD